MVDSETDNIVIGNLATETLVLTCKCISLAGLFVVSIAGQDN